MEQFRLLCVLCLLCALCVLCLLCALCAHSGMQRYEIIVNSQFSIVNYLCLTPFSHRQGAKEMTKKQISERKVLK